MKRWVFLVLFVVLSVALSSCGGSKSSVKIVSVEYTDSINSGGVSFTFEGMDIIKIVLDFKFDASIVSGLDPDSEDYRKGVYAILVKGAHFYLDGQEIQNEFGYWPKEAGKDSAKEMSLFYLVPAGHSVQGFRFVYDGSVLGSGASGLDTAIDPR